MAEQIEKRTCMRLRIPGVKRLLKRMASRQRRRAEKRDPENVPPRMTRGWSD